MQRGILHGVVMVKIKEAYLSMSTEIFNSVILCNPRKKSVIYTLQYNITHNLSFTDEMKERHQYPSLTFICHFYLLFTFFHLSMRPNIFLAMGEDSAQHRRWYYELVVDHIDSFLTSEPTHLRVGWACTEGYQPRPTGGEGWGGNGVGDDLCSYSFDGLHLWSGEDEIKPEFTVQV